MGYDMSIRGDLPAADPEVVATLNQKYETLQAQLQEAADAAGKEFMWALGYFRKDGEPDDRSEELQRAAAEYDEVCDAKQAIEHPGYFRLNIWGMSRYAEAMSELGMLHYPSSYADAGPWPDYDSFFPEGADELDPDVEKKGEEEYNKAVEPKLAYHDPSEPPTIPDHKFSSNDGWIVTPAEIEAALAAWEVAEQAPGFFSEETQGLIKEPYWLRWISYLHLAKDHGGFQVY